MSARKVREFSLSQPIDGCIEQELFKINKRLSYGHGLNEELVSLASLIIKSASFYELYTEATNLIDRVLRPNNLKLSFIGDSETFSTHLKFSRNCVDHSFMSDIRHGLVDYNTPVIQIDRFTPMPHRQKTEHALGQKLDTDKVYVLISHEYERELFASFILCLDESLSLQELNFLLNLQRLVIQRAAMLINELRLLKLMNNQRKQIEDIEEIVLKLPRVQQAAKMYEE